MSKHPANSFEPFKDSCCYFNAEHLRDANSGAIPKTFFVRVFFVYFVVAKEHTQHHTLSAFSSLLETTAPCFELV